LDCESGMRRAARGKGVSMQAARGSSRAQASRMGRYVYAKYGYVRASGREYGIHRSMRSRRGHAQAAGELRVASSTGVCVRHRGKGGGEGMEGGA
jgi:hypothetical protein